LFNASVVAQAKAHVRDKNNHAISLPRKTIQPSDIICVKASDTGVSLKILIDFNEHIDFPCKF